MSEQKVIIYFDPNLFLTFLSQCCSFSIFPTPIFQDKKPKPDEPLKEVVRCLIRSHASVEQSTEEGAPVGGVGGGGLWPPGVPCKIM